jgi:hypothetical protein
MEPNAYPNPSPKLGALGGTLLVIALHITREELLKTVVLAAIGAAVSFAVSLLLQRLLRKMKR